MLIVTAGSNHKKYYRTIEFCKSKCEEYGYQFKVYDLGGLGFGTPYSDPRLAAKYTITRCAVKPEIILKTLNETDEDLIAWIDGDATLIRPIDELEADTSFDVALTIRPKRRIKKTHYVNAGVMFFRNNQQARTFIEEWIAAFPPMPPLDSTVRKEIRYYSDQNTLEDRLLLPNIEGPLWDQIQSIHEIHGAKVKLLDCAEYNHWQFDVILDSVQPTNVKIIHFKGEELKATKRVMFEDEPRDLLAIYCRRYLNE